MVALDLDVIPSTFEVVSQLLHRSYDCLQFSAVRVIVLLGRASVFARVKTYSLVYFDR
jgi:hypothetical protein